MTTTTPELRERVALAAREFERLRPTLQSFTRALTGKALVLQAGPTSGTDGKTVYLRPPILLADRAGHERSLCLLRDDLMQPRCPACARSEAVYTTLFHEISHLVAGSLDTLPRWILRRAAIRGAARGSAAFQKWIDESTAGREHRMQDAYDFLIEVHPHFLAWIRVMDDARIDAESFRARPGVEVMRFSQTYALLRRGIDVNGTYEHWRDRPVEQQFPIAALIITQGHDPAAFSDEVAQTLALPEFDELRGRIPRDNTEAAELAVAWLGALNKLGLYELPLPEDDQDDEQDDQQPGQQDEQENESDSDESAEPGTDDAGTDDAGSEAQGGNGTELPGQAGPDRGDETGEPGEPALTDDDPAGSGDDTGAGGGGSGDAAEDDGPGSEGDRGSGDDADAGLRGDDRDPGDDHGLGGEGGSEPATGSGPVTEPGGDCGADAEESDVAEPDVTEQRDLLEQHFSGVEHCAPDEVSEAVDVGTGHREGNLVMHGGDGAVSDEVMETAINQALFFDSYSARVVGLIVHRPGEGAAYQSRRRAFDHTPIPESALAPSVMRARRVFSDSKLDRNVRNLRRGKLNQGALARRAPFGDDRVFQQTLRAEGIDFEVIVGMDISYSTSDGCIVMIKQAAEGLATVLHRVGVSFAVYAHTTDNPYVLGSSGYRQSIYPVKTAQQPWGPEQRRLLADLAPAAGSLDGHNLEFYRKVLQRSRARKKLLVYFTDGEIPDTNAVEEKEILERESATYRRLGYSILGVGIRNDSPKKFGLDTIRIDTGDDIVTVIREIEKRITS